MSTLLAAADIGVKRAGRLVLDHVSLTVQPGELLAILGPNGSGKSTLLKTFCGILTPAAGDVRLDDRPLGQWRATERARQISYVAQDPELAWNISVEELVTLGLQPASAGLSVGFGAALDGSARTLLEEALEAFSLGPLRHRSVQSLSGGERARALVARALVGRPRILLADEPTAHLDFAYQVEIMQHIGRRCRSRGMAGVVVVHDANLAVRFADRIVLMCEGRILRDTDAHAALADPIYDSIYRQSFERIERSGRIYLLAEDLREANVRECNP